MNKRLAQGLQTARETAHLEREHLAQMLGVPELTIERVEACEEAPGAALVRRWATALGRTLGEVLRESDQGTPLGALMRSASDTATDRGALLGRVEESFLLWQTIGRATTIVRHAAGLSPEMADWRSKLQADRVREHAKRLGWTAVNALKPWKEGELLARAARRVLADGGWLGEESPIDSMTTLFSELGIALMVAPEDSLPDTISAVLLVDGEGAGVLLNAGGCSARRLRWTLAHELCHLLVDQDVLASGGVRQALLLASAREGSRMSGRRTGYRPPSLSAALDDFEAMEQRANAFAAYFLAPRAEVRKAMGIQSDAPTPDERAVLLEPSSTAHVADTFGISMEAALQHLANCYPDVFTEGDRYDSRRMPSHGRWQSERFVEAALPRAGGDQAMNHDGFPPRWFAHLVVKAVEDGRLSLGNAYDILAERPTVRLGSSVGLTEGPGPLRDPVFDASCRVRNWLADNEATSLQDVVFDSGSVDDGGFVRLQLHGRRDDGSLSVLCAFVSPEGSVRLFEPAG